MPIQIKDFTWNESSKTLYITVPLKGVKPSKVDIFTTEEYIKVHYPPYFFDVWLNQRVNDSTSRAEVGNGAVLFKLEKENEGLWVNLQHPESGDKNLMKKVREDAITRHQERQEEQRKEKSEKKRLADKFAVQQQMDLEREEKERIENVKKSECDQATQELEIWKDEQKNRALQEQDELRRKLEEHTISQAQPHEISHNRSKSTKTRGKKKNIFEVEAGDQPLRSGGKIEVSFTHRDFPTAARESTIDAENEWLKKQADARKVAEIADSELSEHEKDPVWLKDKGIEFFKAGNYQAAINVFSHGIRLTKNPMPALYSNRGACHMKLRNFIKCIEDVSKALELLTPPVAQNAQSRLKAHIRRGSAFCELELYAEGLQDYEAALKIEPDNEEIKIDAERIRDIIQGTTIESQENTTTPKLGFAGFG